jgi:hypothetical protein
MRPKMLLELPERALAYTVSCIQVPLVLPGGSARIGSREGHKTVRETWCCCTSRRGLDYGGEIIVEPLRPRTTPKVGVNLGM